MCLNVKINPNDIYKIMQVLVMSHLSHKIFSQTFTMNDARTSESI
uniref:Uncharacterized protein n=1 Tax=Rhizophora mucronata TaxID=61149 RepID=A0A2P2QEB3_RHIMU